jgi:hypothetical protein
MSKTRKMPLQSEKHKDLIGRKFGRLTVQRIIDDGSVEWFGCLVECRCNCGNMHTIGRRYLTRGQSKSCGCLNTDARKIYGAYLKVTK